MNTGPSGPDAPGRAPLEIEPYTHDDALVASTRADQRTRVSVYAFPQTAVVLGRGSDPHVELHTGQVHTDGVPVFRRRGGGCAVVLDPGNVVATVAIALPGLDRIRTTFDHLTAWLIAGLERIGVAGVTSDGVSDLVVDNRKIAGSCVHRALGLFTYSASLLVEPDVPLMSRYLAHPPREPEYRRGRGHDAFVTSIGKRWRPSDDVPTRGAGERTERVAAFRDALEGSLGEVELD